MSIPIVAVPSATELVSCFEVDYQDLEKGISGAVEAPVVREGMF